MASGLYARASLPANAFTDVFVTAAAKATYNIRFCNTGTTTALIRLSLSVANPPVDGEYIEFGAILNPGDVLEEQGIPLQAGIHIIAWASMTGINVNVWGIE